MPPYDHREITQLLHSWQAGNSEARAELWSLLYEELKMLARRSLRRQGGGGVPRGSGTTSLVHEAFRRLLGTEIDWADRQHFFAVASRAMRFVLIDEARRQLTDKRAGELVAEPHGPFTDDGVEIPDPIRHRPEEVLAVHEALGRLAKINPRHERLVELRYFAGLSVDETAEVLGVASRTVVRDWRAVRIWLHDALETAV